MLKDSREVVQHGMIRVVLVKDLLEMGRHHINKGIADTLWEHLVASKGVHCTHHALVVGKHRYANLVPVTINVALFDVVKGGLRLIHVAIANFHINECTNLVPGQLQNLAVNLDADVV